MGGTTPNRSIRYPYASDPANAIAQYFFNMAADVDAALGAIPGWTAVTGFATGAGPAAGAYAPAYRLLPSGKVELRGGIAAGASFAAGGVVLFTLPALSPSLYPAANIIVSAGTNYAAGTTVNSQWQINTSGQVAWFGGTGVTLVSLDGVYYYTS